jgi:hypothetical protein
MAQPIPKHDGPTSTIYAFHRVDCNWHAPCVDYTSLSEGRLQQQAVPRHCVVEEGACVIKTSQSRPGMFLDTRHARDAVGTTHDGWISRVQ